MEEWEEAVRRITQKANEIENALAHSIQIETLYSLLSELTQDINSSKVLILRAADGARILQQLETRLRALNRRVNIIKMSYETEDAKIKIREQRSDCQITHNTERLNKYIKIASHSLSSIEKQRDILRGSRKKVEDGLVYLGLSDRVVDQISNRYLTDYRIFRALTGIFILLFIYVFILRK